MITSICGPSFTSVFRPPFNPVSKTNVDIVCKKRKGSKKYKKEGLEQKKTEVEDKGLRDDQILVIDDEVTFPKEEIPGNYIIENGEIIKEVGYYTPFGYEIKNHETKKERAKRLKNFNCTEVVHEQGNDIYWPPVPGWEIPAEQGLEVVANMNKPRPVDPELEERYRDVEPPSLQEIDAEFLLKAKDFNKLVKERTKHFDLFDDRN